MTKYICGPYDPNARELCLHLAAVCEACNEWEGARILRRTANHLYNLMFRFRLGG